MPPNACRPGRVQERAPAARRTPLFAARAAPATPQTTDLPLPSSSPPTNRQPKRIAFDRSQQGPFVQHAKTFTRSEERACPSASANSNARARVSKDEDERLPCALMLRDASLRAGCRHLLLVSHCDAPQHEGKGGRWRLGQTNEQPSATRAAAFSAASL